jgi:hypothetical protein
MKRIYTLSELFAIPRRVIVARGDVETLNGRIYSSSLLKKIAEQINSYPICYGELGHPESTTVSLTNASHEFKNASVSDHRGNTILEVDITILRTRNGKILKKDLDNYVFRLRGTGIVGKDKKVNPEYTFISIDAVLKKNDPYKGLI